ncbi:hypothetical protein [Elizabethkingia meningoseptica]|uniref:hypothetical protein n=1 Tax=Elizabethkingia meningoseptica TaxID=238 RepID=UPI0030175DE6
MMQNSHDVKGRILEEVKKLASDIASVQSTVGLITNYQKVQALYEKVAFLKILTEESIDIHQRKNELEAMIEANPTHDKSEEALEKEREVRAAYETDEATDEAPEEISEITHEEEPPIASEEKENVIVPKTENIIENDHSEEEDYVNTLEENQYETNEPETIRDEAEQPEEIIASVQEEPVQESEEYKTEATETTVDTPIVAEGEEEETEIYEDGDHEEMKPVSENAEETIEQPETTAEIKEPEIYTEELFAPEPSETHKMTEEELASHKVKLASIKGLKQIVREQIAEENPATEESIKAGDNAAFTPMNASASVQVGQFRLDLNDRMAFLKKLFNNDDGEMKIVLEKLNEFQTLDEAKEFLSDIYYDKDWKSADEYAQRLWSLVESRFR